MDLSVRLSLGIVWKCGFRCCSIHFHIQLNLYGLFTIVEWESLDICEIISWGLCESQMHEKQSCIVLSLYKPSTVIAHSFCKCLCSTLHGLNIHSVPSESWVCWGCWETWDCLNEGTMGYVVWFSRIIPVVVLKLSIGDAAEINRFVKRCCNSSRKMRQVRLGRRW
jgi:hypothetical protein